MSILEVEDNMKIYAAHIKRLATSKSAPVNSYSENSTRVPRKKKARTGVLTDYKHKVKKKPKYHGAQRY